MTKIRIPEKDIQRSILSYLEKRSVLAWRNNSGAFLSNDERTGKKYMVRFGLKGSPDIICVIAGRFVGLEVKAHDGKMSPDQVAFSMRLKRAGGIYFCVKSMDDAIEAIEDCIRRLRIKDMPLYRVGRNDKVTKIS